MTRLRLAAPALRRLCLGLTLLVACTNAPPTPISDSPSDGGPASDAAPPGGGDACAVQPPAMGDAAKCPVVVVYQPTRAVTAVAIAGEWNGWSTSAQKLSGPDGSGKWSAMLRLAPGVYAYKIVLDGSEWRLDDGNSYRKYDGGIENSGLRVADCHKPTLRLVPGSLKNSRPSAGHGALDAEIEVVAAVGAPPGLCSLKSSLRSPSSHKSTGTALPAVAGSALTTSPDRRRISLHLSDLSDGKYTVTLQGQAGGQDSESLLLPFWIEAEKFSFADTPLYMAVTDRFANGEPKNDLPLPGVITPANFQGGDLQGVAQQIEAGYFDTLGIRALWLTPFYTQPDGAYIDSSGTYPVASYHGYWPIKARGVDPRIGGDEALHTVVEAAHRHGIRVLMDAVLNHVHEKHEYFQDPAKKSWFRTGCICGTTNCDWTAHRLDCLFSPYMPDINWTVSDASEQFISDALYWTEEFDLDGLRIDAVKHVEDLAILNLTARVRERFEQAGTHSYLLGETAMGWSDGSIADNRENYDTIKRYMGPNALDGQFDFVWYHGIAYRVFAYDEKRFLHVDYWSHASLDQFKGSLMVPYLGSHDTSRFLTLATYRDASGPFARDIAFNKWDKLPAQPLGIEPYDRLWLGMLTTMTLPGMPLLYYGDEYGEYGGGDPDNRHLMRRGSQLGTHEVAQLARMQKLLKARAGSRGLRRGDLLTVLLGEEVYAYARLDPLGDPHQVALVILNRQPFDSTAAVPLPPELGFAPGASLHDLLGGPGYTTSGSLLNVTVPARSAVILALD